MIWILCLAALLQGEPEKRIAELDHENPEIRAAAAKDLAARGAAVAPALFDHYRATASTESRAQIEALLLQIPFPALLLSRAGEPIRERLEAQLLQPLAEHRPHAGCWKEKDQRIKLDPARLRIVWQDGSGHGQMLRLKWITPDDAGGLTFRRVIYQGKTPYRPKVTEEGVTVDEMRLGAVESAALLSLLEQATSLTTGECAIPELKTPGRVSFSTASFTIRLRIQVGDAEVWRAGYTGYPGSSGKPRYIHSRAVESVLDVVSKHLAWKPSTLTRQDRSDVSAWILANFDREEWWIQEHFLCTARYAGDETLLPLLKRVVASTPGETQHSEKRQVEQAREALSALERGK